MFAIQFYIQSPCTVRSQHLAASQTPEEKHSQHAKAHMHTPLKDRRNEPVRIKMGGTQLEQKEIGIHHGVAEVALDVRHGLALDLQSIARPEATQYFVERHLHGTEAH